MSDRADEPLLSLPDCEVHFEESQGCSSASYRRCPQCSRHRPVRRSSRRLSC